MKLSGRLSVTLIVTLCVLGAVPIDGTALADVPLKCHPSQGENKVCSCSVFDNQRVHIYLKTDLSGLTHYNFKTNPGAQIELANGGHYSFQPKRGASGTYSAQACSRGGLGSRSVCTKWATWDWNTERAGRNCLSPGGFGSIANDPVKLARDGQ